MHVQLEQFEGPLGLLLYLIRKEEMDIYNIQIHKITSQYLEYIRSMKELDLEGAGDFVAMAATLIHIKSKMLLPNYNEVGEVVENEDPRKELVQRLVEYQKYQEASKKLYERPLLGRDTFGRGMKEEYEEGVEEIILEENGLFQMISLYRSAIQKLKKRIHKVYAKGQSVASRIMEIKDKLIPGRQVEMRELLGEHEHTRTKLLITFLSLLELARLGFISVFQAETYGEIYVDTKRNVERDVVVRVQEYDQKTPDQVAAGWMEKANTADGADKMVMPTGDEEWREPSIQGALAFVSGDSENLNKFTSEQLSLPLASLEDGESANTLTQEIAEALTLENPDSSDNLSSNSTLDGAALWEKLLDGGDVEFRASTGPTMISEEIATDEDLLEAEIELGFVTRKEPKILEEPAAVDDTNSFGETEEVISEFAYQASLEVIDDAKIVKAEKDETLLGEHESIESEAIDSSETSVAGLDQFLKDDSEDLKETHGEG